MIMRRCIIRVAEELDYFSAHIRIREPDKLEDKTEKVLVMKGDEEVENTEVNSKYEDKTRGQRLRNFIRPVATSFSSR
ncbi:hypothetical protein B296_00032432 [Ensete ventricosum]|uniref:Uncharacterized protein n=1 Tax=Ensete ventricosum TaxID=4639 RepID=A0A426YND9_ENSVE|nr:hypothetical protein B296_00032432 [Ensete ventricosum]